MCEEKQPSLSKNVGGKELTEIRRKCEHLTAQVQRLEQDKQDLTDSLERMLPSVIEKKILILEDHDLLLMAVKDMFEAEGYQARTAKDGIDAMKVLDSFTPDIIVADISMPRMDGYTFFEEVKRRPGIASVPFVFLTARAERRDRLKGLSMGAVEYIVKPFNREELLDIIRTRLLIAATVDTPNHNTVLIDEIKRLKKQLIDARNQLKAQKINFSSISSAKFPLSEISRLTDGIVHDMRSSLGIISHTLGFLEPFLKAEESKADIDRINSSLELCELIMRNLTALGGRDILNPTWLDLESIATNVYFLLERKLNNVSLEIRAEPDIPKILGDKGQMKQVFMNIIKNAGEAMPAGGALTVDIQLEGKMVQIKVADTGCGIPSENVDRLFSEFFTTKERGYGLGLHIVQTVVHRHGGTVEVESEVGKGTTFTLLLPIETGALDDQITDTHRRR
jgi:signal transduction histidine kinase